MKKDLAGTKTDQDENEATLGPDKLAQDLKQAPRTEVADYIAASLIQLRLMSMRQDLKFLVYLVEMAYQEAYQQANPTALEGSGDLNVG